MQRGRGRGRGRGGRGSGRDGNSGGKSNLTKEQLDAQLDEYKVSKSRIDIVLCTSQLNEPKYIS